MSKIQWEYDLVERPLCQQLERMGEGSRRIRPIGPIGQIRRAGRGSRGTGMFPS